MSKPSLLEEFNCNPPLSDEAYASFKSQRAPKLPQDYLDFMKKTDGGEGFIGSTYIILWNLEDLPKLNDDYQVAQYAPGLYLFGSNGGGEAFAFDIRTPLNPIVRVPFVGMDLSEVRLVAAEFGSFLQNLHNS